MWEIPRQDGTRKLKTQAVPTIFPAFKKRLPETAVKSLDTLKAKKTRNNEDFDENSKEPTRIVPNHPQSNIDEEHHEENSLASFVDNVEISDLINCDTYLVLSTDNNVCSNESTNVSAASTSNVTPSTLECAQEQIKLLQRELRIKTNRLEHKDKELKQIKQQLENANKVVRKSDKTKKTLMNHIRKLRSTNRLRVENTLLQSKELLHKVFNSDQIEWLQTKSSRRVYKLSKETIKKALQIKFSCTTNGYQGLIKENIPLPSTRTLRRSLEDVDFSPGILNDMFDVMKNKVEKFTDQRQCDCILGVDEMSLAPGEQPDPSTNSVVGSSTIPNSRGNSYTFPSLCHFT